jgi:hypothetical protein
VGDAIRSHLSVTQGRSLELPLLLPLRLRKRRRTGIGRGRGERRRGEGRGQQRGDVTLKGGVLGDRSGAQVSERGTSDVNLVLADKKFVVCLLCQPPLMPLDGSRGV